jgi:hypothetical protein
MIRDLGGAQLGTLDAKRRFCDSVSDVMGGCEVA